MAAKSLFLAGSMIGGLTLAACGNSPGPATIITCSSGNTSSITAPAGTLNEIEVVETVSLADTGVPGETVPLNNANATVYASEGHTAMCTDSTCGTTQPSVTFTTDKNAVGTFYLQFRAPAVGGTETDGVTQVFGAAGNCTLSFSVTGA